MRSPLVRQQHEPCTRRVYSLSACSCWEPQIYRAGGHYPSPGVSNSLTWRNEVFEKTCSEIARANLLRNLGWRLGPTDSIFASAPSVGIFNNFVSIVTPLLFCKISLVEIPNVFVNATVKFLEYPLVHLLESLLRAPFVSMSTTAVRVQPGRMQPARYCYRGRDQMRDYREKLLILYWISLNQLTRKYLQDPPKGCRLWIWRGGFSNFFDSVKTWELRRSVRILDVGGREWELYGRQTM